MDRVTPWELMPFNLAFPGSSRSHRINACSSGTGFSREGVLRHTETLMLYMLAFSRLKPVPQYQRVLEWDRLQPGRRHASHRNSDVVHAGLFPAKAGPTGSARATSRLKPVPQDQLVLKWDRLQPGRRHAPHRKSEGVHTGFFPAKAGPTGSTRARVGPASAGKASCVTPKLCRCTYWPFPG